MATRPQDRPAQGPFSILVEPQMGENIGAAARALWNFGLRRMRLVAPRDGWPNPKAVATASGAGALLDKARICSTTEEAIADLHVVYATTARPRELTKRVLTPEAAMREAAGLIAAGKRVGVLYGGERAGLRNEDIIRASAIISVPVNPEFSSLNLAQCVLLTAYEWRRAFDETPAETLAGEKAELAEAGTVARFLDHLTDELDAAGFFFPEHKRPAMEATLRNLFHRLALTDQDVRTLWGITRALAEGPKRRGAEARRGNGAGARPEDCADMPALRRAVDALDDRLVALLAEREALIGRAAEIKAGAGLPARIPERVEEVVGRVRALSADRGLDPDHVERLWRQIIEAAIALEERSLGR